VGGLFDELTDGKGEAQGTPAFGQPAFGGDWTPPPAPKEHTEPFEIEEDPFFPREPDTLEEAGLSRTFVEHLLLKTVHDYPGQSGNEIAASMCLNPTLVRTMLGDLKRRMLMVHAAGDAAGDFHFDLSRDGRQLAKELKAQSTYVGPAPVTLAQYRRAVEIQSISRERIGPADLDRAFGDLMVKDQLVNVIGPAMTSGRGVFLFGEPGNGKTSMALRMARAYHWGVYIPQSVLVEGSIVQVHDPQVHESAPRSEDAFSSTRTDRRWVRCRRPTVVASGELTLDSLELHAIGGDHGPCEAPLQMKANCGLLVIDDFGRQQEEPSALLNRWILPLENRVDFLRLPNGRKIQIPFDPLLIFSTNLDPAELVDEAFLRRIPYKVHVSDPTPKIFRELLRKEATTMGFPVQESALDQLIVNCYQVTGRKMRYCHARDLLLQIRNQCLYENMPLTITPNAVERAAKAYFTLL
jgi:predicted ATPase with chaperone activity